MALSARPGGSFRINSWVKAIRFDRLGASSNPFLHVNAIIVGSVRQDPLRPAVVRRSAATMLALQGRNSFKPCGVRVCIDVWGREDVKICIAGNHVQILQVTLGCQDG